MGKYLAFIISSILLLPCHTFAQVVITEIMYDLDGSDSGREWVEILNDEDEGVDLSVWRFYENETNHKLNLFRGSEILEAGEYAIIADNTEKFLLDWPGFSGTVFDSSFSLKNTGEAISLRNSDLVDIDQVTYNPDWGAGGDGNSLQRSSGDWITGIPTPGDVNVGTTNQSSPDSDGTGQASDVQQDAGQTDQPMDSSQQDSVQLSSVYSFLPIENIKAFIKDRETFAVVGATALFEGYALGLKDEPLLSARFVWNFGDGGTKEGQNVLHTYRYPGEYVVALDVSSGEYGASARMILEVVPAEVSIVSVGFDDDSHIELANESGYEINLHGWMLKSGDGHFVIHKNTFILPRKTLIFSPEVTKLLQKEEGDVLLLYPDGKVASRYSISSLARAGTVLAPALAVGVVEHEAAKVNVKTSDVPRTSDVQTLSIVDTQSKDFPRVSSQQGSEHIEDSSNPPKNTSQAASVGNAKVGTESNSAGAVIAFKDSQDESGGGFFSVWFAAISGLTFVAITGFLFMRKNPLKPIEPEGKLAEEIEMSEIKGD